MTKLSIAVIIINDGIRDITFDYNKYGVARNLLKNILSYRVYTEPYDELRAGFIPDRRNNYDQYKALKIAVKRNYIHILDHFQNLWHPYRWNHVYTAIYYGHTHLAKRLMGSDKPDIYHKAIVEAYARRNRIDLIENMELNIDPSICICKGAARGGHLDLVEKYFKSSINTYDKSDILDQAAYGGHIDIIKFLVNHDCRILPSHIEKLVYKGHTEHLEEVSRLYDINIGQPIINSWFYAAIRGGRKDLVYSLLPKVNNDATCYRNALKEAMINHRYELIEFFKKRLGFRTINLPGKDFMLYA